MKAYITTQSVDVANALGLYRESLIKQYEKERLAFIDYLVKLNDKKFFKKELNDMVIQEEINNDFHQSIRLGNIANKYRNFIY